jgi:signal transduction histidine kinase
VSVVHSGRRRLLLAVAGAASLAGLAPARVTGEADPDLPLLTRIRAIRALSPAEAERRYPVRIRGAVTFLDEDWPAGLIVHDGEAGQFVLYAEPYFKDHPRFGLRRGDLVEVVGTTARGGFAPNVDPTSVRALGRAEAVLPKHLPYAALLTGRYDCEYVEIAGVGQRAWVPAPPAAGLFLEIATDGGIVRASLWSARPGDVERFVDARLRLRGNVGALFGEAGQLRGVTLLGGTPAEVVIEEPPPAPFTLPARPISSLYRYTSGGELDRRTRVRGVVTAQRIGLPAEITDFTTSLKYRDVRHVVYLRDETGALRVETAQDLQLNPGDAVDVAGFPAVTSTKPTLRNAVLARLGPGPEPPAAILSPDRPLAPERDAELVRVEARVLGVVAGPSERSLVLQMGETPFEAVLDAAAVPAAFEEPATGSVISVTGVYDYQGGPPPSFRLRLRSPRDVSLITAAPWWTLRHTAVLGMIVALVGSAAALWVRVIANRHLLAHERYQAILAERTRLARELHDTLEQGLAGTKLQLEAVAGSLETSPEVARRSLHVAREMLRYNMEEVRRSVMDLRSQALENRDIAAALADLAARMTSGTPLRADVRVVGSPRPLDASVEHHLFRIGVEALTNAIKHSGAAHIDVELSFGKEGTELVVCDDGAGFARPGSGVAVDHFGLRGIHERVDKLGGALRLEDRPGGGTRLAVSVPLREPPPAPASTG